MRPQLEVSADILEKLGIKPVVVVFMFNVHQQLRSYGDGATA